MIELKRQGRNVWYGGALLTRVDQSSKGPGNEVIKIEGLPGTNGQKWVSLSKLQEGMNSVECKGREVTAGKAYRLTQAEQDEVDKLEARIKEIKDTARGRYVAKPRFVDPTVLNEEQKKEKALEVEKYLKALRGE
jgi:hypothetical protein